MRKRDVLGEFEMVVLMAVIRLRENAYGMTLRREILERTGRDVSIGALYTTLDRLEHKGYVSSWVGDPTPERGGRAKKFFKIEAPGQHALGESLNALKKMGTGLRLAWGTR